MKNLIINLKHVMNSAKFTVTDNEAIEILEEFKSHGGDMYANEKRILSVDGVQGKGVFAMNDIAGIHADFTEDKYYGDKAD